MKLYRQGDVLLIERDVTPNASPKRYAQMTVAFGEATGHHHTLYPNTKRGGEPETLEAVAPASYIEEFLYDGKRFVRLDTDWLLRHQEHRELRIEPGTYEIIIEREYDPIEETRKRVID